MDNITSKCGDSVKIEVDRNLCQGCLSSDRTLVPLSHNIELYLYLLGHPHVLPEVTYDDIVLCWECRALLQNVHKFQSRIQNAQFIMQQYFGRETNETPPKLSTLSSIEIRIPEKFMVYQEIVTVGSAARNIQDDKERTSVLITKVTGEKKTKNEDNKAKVTTVVVPDAAVTNVECKEEIPDSDGQDNYDYEAPVEFQDIEDVENKIKTECKPVKHYSRPRAVDLPLKKFKKKAKITINKDIELNNLSKYYQTVFVSNDHMLDLIKRDQRKCRKNKLQYKCKKCKLGFSLKVDYARHETFVHRKQARLGSHKCKECLTVVPSWEELVTHWNQHNYVFRCHLCGWECRRNGDVRRHLETHVRVYTCLKCQAIFHTQKEFSSHYRELHRRLVCDDCGQKFMRKESIVKHIKRHHMPAKCDDCNIVYKRYEGLLRHNCLVHPGRVKKRAVENTELMYCVECDIQFPNVLKYRRHLSTAVVHKPPKRIRVPCPVCEKVFTRKLYMKNHYMLTHLRKSDHQCQLCNKYFSSAYGVRKHVWAVHDKIPKPKNKVCDICGRAFATNRILTNHRRTHTGERPHRCAHCSAAFAQKAALQAHARTQHAAAAKHEPTAGRQYNRHDGVLTIERIV